MSERLSDVDVDAYAAFVRAQPHPFEGRALLLGFLAEVRERRAAEERVRATVKAWCDEQHSTENEQDMLDALAEEITAALDGS